MKQGHFPEWLHRKLPASDSLSKTRLSIVKNRLHTVCEEAKCPNLMECYSKKTATFLVMGKGCTRACPFCDIDFSKKPVPLDEEEPANVAEAVFELGLKHVVITMVARDDLADGGAAHLIKVMQAVRKKCPNTTLEVLTSDFQGSTQALDMVLHEKPEIFNHNVETVQRLTPKVRHTATYERSLMMLQHAKKHNPKQLVKSGLMVGLGEEQEEILAALQDLHQAGCDIVTIGQYLKPSSRKLEVKAFIPPSQFDAYAAWGKKLGLKYVYAGPFVRSSYNAGVVWNNMNIESQ